MKVLFGLVGLLVLIASSIACGAQGELATESAAPASEPAQLPGRSSGMHFDQTTTPSGSLLRYTLSMPRGYDANQPVPLIMALHYGGDVTPHYGAGLIDFLVEPGLGELGAIIVAPDALGGGDWTTSKNEQAVEWLTRSIMASYAVDPKKVAITGYSMGGEGAWYIGGRHQDLFTAVIPVEGDPAGKNLEWTVPIYVIHSWDDEIISSGPVEEHVKQLKEQGAPVELHMVSGLSHYETPAFALPLREAVPWLNAVWSE